MQACGVSERNDASLATRQRSRESIVSIRTDCCTMMRSRDCGCGREGLKSGREIAGGWMVVLLG